MYTLKTNGLAGVVLLVLLTCVGCKQEGDLTESLGDKRNAEFDGILMESNTPTGALNSATFVDSYHIDEQGVLILTLSDGTLYSVDSGKDVLFFRGEDFKVVPTESGAMIHVPKELEKAIK